MPNTKLQSQNNLFRSDPYSIYQIEKDLVFLLSNFNGLKDCLFQTTFLEKTNKTFSVGCIPLAGYAFGSSVVMHRKM